MTDFDQIEDDENFISKTQIKREMEALQALGKKLLGLSKAQQKKVEMSDTLRDALAEADRIKKHEAMRRHMQYIGRIMRTEDHESIAARIELFDTTSAAHNKMFHQLENLRDALIGENSQSVLQEYLTENPSIDIQHFRQVVRQAQKEVSQNGKTTNRKKLFKLLRETQDKKLGLA